MSWIQRTYPLSDYTHTPAWKAWRQHLILFDANIQCAAEKRATWLKDRHDTRYFNDLLATIEDLAHKKYRMLCEEPYVMMTAVYQDWLDSMHEAELNHLRDEHMMVLVVKDVHFTLATRQQVTISAMASALEVKRLLAQVPPLHSGTYGGVWWHSYADYVFEGRRNNRKVSIGVYIGDIIII